MQMTPIRVFLFGLIIFLVGFVVTAFAMPSVGVAKERDAENCTTSHNIKPQIRIAACTRILKAREIFEDFGNVAALSNRASAFAQLENYDRALRDLNSAVNLLEKLDSRLDEDSIERLIAAGIYGKRGIMHLALGRYSEAASDFKIALSIEPAVIERYKEVLRHLDASD